MTTYKTILFKGQPQVECYTEERPLRLIAVVEGRPDTPEPIENYNSRLYAWQKSAILIPFKSIQDFEKTKALGREDVTTDVEILDRFSYTFIAGEWVNVPWPLAIFREPVKEEGEERKNNFNNWVEKDGLNKWHKVDKDNFIPPPTNYNLVFFVKGGSIYCGEYKGSVGFTCYGIGHKELTDVEVTYWRILDFPKEYQQTLDDMDEKFKNQPK